MSKLLPCPDCDRAVSPTAAVCPHCGRPLVRRRRAVPVALQLVGTALSLAGITLFVFVGPAGFWLLALGVLVFAAGRAIPSRLVRNR